MRKILHVFAFAIIALGSFSIYALQAPATIGTEQEKIGYAILSPAANDLFNNLFAGGTADFKLANQGQSINYTITKFDYRGLDSFSPTVQARVKQRLAVFGLDRLYRVEATQEQNLDQVLKFLQGNGLAERAEHLPIFTVFQSQEPPRYPQGLEEPLAKYQYYYEWRGGKFPGELNPGPLIGNDLRGPQAHFITRGRPYVRPINMDTGIDVNHEEATNTDLVLSKSMVPTETDIQDRHFHGTVTSGVGFAPINKRGIVGIAPETGKVIHIKVLNQGGWGFYEWIANGYAYVMGLQETLPFETRFVINNSFGGPGFSDIMFRSYQAVDDGRTLITVAAGNTGKDLAIYPHIPAYFAKALPHVVSVASLQMTQRELSNFSSYSSEDPELVTIAAPGEKIFAPTLGLGNRYGTFNGTSLSSPQTGGVAALVWSRFPQLTASQVKQRLIASSVPIAATGKKILGGQLNALRALSDNLTPPPAPTPHTLTVGHSLVKYDLPIDSDAAGFIVKYLKLDAPGKTTVQRLFTGSTKTILVDNLEPESDYRLDVAVFDAAGNVSESVNFNVHTLFPYSLFFQAFDQEESLNDWEKVEKPPDLKDRIWKISDVAALLLKDAPFLEKGRTLALYNGQPEKFSYNYNDSIHEESLTSKPVSLPADNSLTFRIFQFIQVDTSLLAAFLDDGAVIIMEEVLEATADPEATARRQVLRVSPSRLGNTNGFFIEERHFDISDWAGKTVRFTLQCATRNPNDYVGWIIADVKVSAAPLTQVTVSR